MAMPMVLPWMNLEGLAGNLAGAIREGLADGLAGDEFHQVTNGSGSREGLADGRAWVIQSAGRECFTLPSKLSR